jgi:hypothetical protein
LATRRPERLIKGAARCNRRRNWLIFGVQLWNGKGPVPQSIGEVLNRREDILFSSRVASHITRLQQTHRLRHVITQLVGLFPDDVRQSKAVRELADYGCLTQMHLVPLVAPRLENENHLKVIDFSPGGISTGRINNRPRRDGAGSRENASRAPTKALAGRSIAGAKQFREVDGEGAEPPEHNEAQIGANRNSPAVVAICNARERQRASLPRRPLQRPLVAS